jgi:hypothetical protein
VLDAALRVIAAHEGSKPATLIGPLSKNLRHALYARLASGGVIRAGQGRILGLFPPTGGPFKTPATKPTCVSNWSRH